MLLSLRWRNARPGWRPRQRCGGSEGRTRSAREQHSRGRAGEGGGSKRKKAAHPAHDERPVPPQAATRPTSPQRIRKTSGKLDNRREVVNNKSPGQRPFMGVYPGRRIGLIIPDKDEAPGSSPGGPTRTGRRPVRLSSGTAGTQPLSTQSESKWSLHSQTPATSPKPTMPVRSGLVVALEMNGRRRRAWS